MVTLLPSILLSDLFCCSFVFSSGPLTPRFTEIFYKNPLYVGVSLPEIDHVEPLEQRYPQLDRHALAFIKVRKND